MNETYANALDELLKLTLNNTVYHHVENILHDQFGIDSEERIAIINYLKEEGYVSGDATDLKITFKGRDLLRQGGFTKQEQDKIATYKEIKFREKRTERNEVLLWIGTFALAFVEILVHHKELANLFCGCH